MDIKEIKRLIDILKNTDVTDMQWEKEGTKIRIKREKFLTTIDFPRQAPQSEAAAHQPHQAQEAVPQQSLVTVTSPLVGTFYRSPSPDAKSFVEVGDRVMKGQVICIVEAMKLMNEIESEVDGRISKVLVENSQPVEYGEPLFLVEPL